MAVGGSSQWNASVDDIATLLKASNVTFDNGSFLGIDTSEDVGGFTYPTAIADSSGGSLGLNKLGQYTLTLSGNNTYTGGTIISGGVLSISEADNLGDSSGGVTLAGGTLQVVTGGVAIPLNTSISGGGSLTTTGTGTLVLSGSNDYSGTTTISGSSTLQAGAEDALSPDSDLVIDSGAFLDMNGFDNEVNTLAGDGTVENSATGTMATLTTGADDTTGTIFSGVLRDDGGQLALTKVGDDTLTLSSANTYTGLTTVSDGILDITGSLASQVSVTGGTVQDPGRTIDDLGADHDYPGLVPKFFSLRSIDPDHVHGDGRGGDRKRRACRNGVLLRWDHAGGRGRFPRRWPSNLDAFQLQSGRRR